MIVSKANYEDLVDLGVLQCRLCTMEESVKYAGMAQAGEKLPSNVYHGKDDAAQYYELSGDINLESVPLELQIKIAQTLRTIKNILIILSVIIIIALIFGVLVIH